MCRLATLTALRKKISEDTAAVIFEPMIAEPVSLSPRKIIFSRSVNVCDHYEALLIIDEVVTGLGEQVNSGAIEHSARRNSDIMISAKGLTGGPLSHGGDHVY